MISNYIGSNGIKKIFTLIKNKIGDISNLKTAEKSNLVSSINQLVVCVNSVHPTASSNGIIDNALLVDLNGNDEYINASHIVDSTYTENMPSDCAWGLREVYIINKNSLVVRIIGVTSDGLNAGMWINCYNQIKWTGWKSL